MNDKAIELLRKLRQYSKGYSAQAMNAVYIPPAQQLRNSADEIEEKEALLAEIDKFLNEN